MLLGLMMGEIKDRRRRAGSRRARYALGAGDGLAGARVA